MQTVPGGRQGGRDDRRPGSGGYTHRHRERTAACAFGLGVAGTDICCQQWQLVCVLVCVCTYNMRAYGSLCVYSMSIYVRVCLAYVYIYIYVRVLGFMSV